MTDEQTFRIEWDLGFPVTPMEGKVLPVTAEGSIVGRAEVVEHEGSWFVAEVTLDPRADIAFLNGAGFQPGDLGVTLSEFTICPATEVDR